MFLLLGEGMKKELENKLMYSDRVGILREDRISKSRQLYRVKTRVIDEAEERQRQIKCREEYKRERLNQSE